MTAEVRTLPIWKRGHTVAEWLEECANLARENPKQWARAVIVFEELNEQGLPVITRQYTFGMKTNNDIVGALEIAKMETFEYMKGRRR